MGGTGLAMTVHVLRDGGESGIPARTRQPDTDRRPVEQALPWGILSRSVSCRFGQAVRVGAAGSFCRPKRVTRRSMPATVEASRSEGPGKVKGIESEEAVRWNWNLS